MGVFKWLRRERVTVSRTQNIDVTPSDEDVTAKSIGTIRTEQYKRDLAEFQARRSAGKNDFEESPLKKKCGRHSLPVSCTSCTSDLDNTFNYEKKSPNNCKNNHKRSKSASSEEFYEALPKIQFVFQNQVFMPGNLFTNATYTEPHKAHRNNRKANGAPSDRTLFTQKHIDFQDDEKQQLSPTFDRNNSLPFDVKKFLGESRCGQEEVDGLAAVDLKSSSQSSMSSHDDSCREKLVEVMSELRSFDQWADEQLKGHASKSEDSKSDTSTCGLPVVTTSDLDVSVDKDRNWNNGKWGAVPVQIKKLTNVTFEQVKKSQNIEINILRKCRHPNVILLMGLYADIHSNIYIICERCEDSLFNILHVQGRILSVQTALRYTLDIANALVFLRMRGYIHSELNSHCIMITSLDVAKLSDFEPCVKVGRPRADEGRSFDLYSPQPQYVNIGDTIDSSLDCEPLLSTHASSIYLASNAASKDHDIYRNSAHYRWHAPELFSPDSHGLVYPCSRSDVYALCLVLWEACNAEIPFKQLSYSELRSQYGVWGAGVRLTADGSYPGAVLQLLQRHLALARQRPALGDFAVALADTKKKIDEMEYIFVPTRLNKPKCGFSSSTSPTVSECLSPVTDVIIHKAVVHNQLYSSTSEKETSKSDASALYDTTVHQEHQPMFAKNCYITDNEDTHQSPDYDNYYSWATPVSKVKAKIKDIGTPGLHRSDSTEYCSILSPNYSYYVTDEGKDKNEGEKSVTKLSRSFTPKSYKPLQIKVPEFNLDCLKSLPQDHNVQHSSEKSSYNFDIKNYSLPSTPIARSNKLRKNAWLSGELSFSERSKSDSKSAELLPQIAVSLKTKSTPETKESSPISDSIEKDCISECSYKQFESDEPSPDPTLDNSRDIFTGLRRTSDPPADFSTESAECRRCWSDASPTRRDEATAAVSVKPLVAIHERWILEARRRTGRSVSLPEGDRAQMPAVKPASHCVDTFQKSLPQLNTNKRTTNKFFKSYNTNVSRNGGQSEQFCQARDSIAKSINFASRDAEGVNTRTWRREEKCDKGMPNEKQPPATANQATDTGSIEEFIRELIRRELHALLDAPPLTSPTPHPPDHPPPTPHPPDHPPPHHPQPDRDHLLDKGVENVLGALKHKREPKTYSKIKINGNNKPLLQISFSHTGENSLKVYDSCVNVTVSDSAVVKEMNHSADEVPQDDVNSNSLKRCQGFSAIQEARSTEDLYIDDDLSTQMQENFGGRIKLIPLHGSIHEILCDKEDDCCLNKVKQENLCDIIYFKCDDADRDAVDGAEDRLLYKHRISYIHESVQRVYPRDKGKLIARRPPHPSHPPYPPRPHSEVFLGRLSEARALSSSSPALFPASDEVEVNIENVLCYQDSSSEECLKRAGDGEEAEFEQLESEIEAELSGSTVYLSSQCLPKISEESLSVIAEEASD